MPTGVWTWGRGEIPSASDAHNLAVRAASTRLGQECATAGGHGVVGVRVEVEVHPRHVDVELVGTAVRPVGATANEGGTRSSRTSRPATSCCCASSAGRRSGSPSARASSTRRAATRRPRCASPAQNVELTNLTEALYAARESAMERMQASGLAHRSASGVVGVRITEGPMRFARHVIGFTAWGTAVRLAGRRPRRHVRPEIVLPLDDAVVQFEAESLRGR